MDDIINQNLNKMMNIKEKNKINLFLIIFFIFLISNGDWGLGIWDFLLLFG